MKQPVRTDELIKLGDLGQRLAISLRRKAMALSTEGSGTGPWPGTARAFDTGSDANVKSC